MRFWRKSERVGYRSEDLPYGAYKYITVDGTFYLWYEKEPSCGGFTDEMAEVVARRADAARKRLLGA